MNSDFRSSIYHYCDYQERCHSQVRGKLLDLGCRGEELEELIAELIEKDLLNEERFARSFARGRFRIKYWGRVKIVQQLKLHKIADYCIKKALTEIDETEYEQTLDRLIEKKWQELKGERSSLARKSKVYNYLLQKGYEGSMIQDAINKLVKNETK